jgi:hypothetical protein
MFNPSRDEVRRFFCETWRKARERLALEPLEVMAAEMIAAHPEYHGLLEKPEAALEQEFTPESGNTNPFLHLSLHLAIAEQLSIDQPPGIRAAFEAIFMRCGDAHEAQHAILDCLGEAIWTAQRNQAPLDALAYVSCARRKA